MTTPVLIASARQGDASSATTSAVDTTGATTILLIVEGVYATTWTISDNKGNSADYIETSDGQHAGPSGGNPGVTMFYIHNPVVGSGHTFTASAGGAQFPTITVEAWSGLDTTQAPYGESASAVSATSAHPGTVTPLSAGDLIITKLAHTVDDLGNAIDSGFTLGNGASNGPDNTAYLIAPNTSPVNPTWTWTTSQAANTVIIAFKVAVATTPPQLAFPISDIDPGTWQAKGPGTEAVVNLLTYTESFDNAAWTKTGCTVSAADAVTDEDGAFTAETLIEDSANSTHLFSYASAIALTANADYSGQVRIRPNGRTIAWLRGKNAAGTTKLAFFQLTSAGSVGSVSTGVTASISQVANDYYLVKFTFNAGTGGGTSFFDVGATTTDNVVLYTGNGLAALDISRPQLEQASSASTYQPILATTPPLVISSTVYPALADSSTGTPVDTDYGFVLVPGSTLKVQLGPLTDPAVNTGHILSVRVYSPQSKSVQFDLYAPSIATIIKTETQATTGGVAQFDYTLDATEADVIPTADYASLQIWMTGIA